MLLSLNSVVFPFILETPTSVYCPAQRSSCFLFPFIKLSVECAAQEQEVG